MTANVAASVRARLTALAQSRGEVVDRIFLRYAIERLLARMARSPYADAFVLKGAMLFAIWAERPYRSTGDLDLLGSGDPAPDRIAAMFRAMCAIPIDEDGVVFDGGAVAVTPMREDADYPALTSTSSPRSRARGCGSTSTLASATQSRPRRSSSNTPHCSRRHRRLCGPIRRKQ